MSDVFPEECISETISFTCARDASRFSVVSIVFKSAADSDAVWEKFLPSDYREIISGSASPLLLTTNLSKKDLYLHLCHNPIIINNGTMGFLFRAETLNAGSGRPYKNLGVYLEGIDNGERRNVYLDPPRNTPKLSQKRGDGWMEIEMGEFFNENGDNGMLICSVFDFKGLHTKRGLIVEGIELRPKDGK
ncbi:hypothetical protein Patl1_25949 [Pistacia atlantica]|uniref:Uncharacterized protein n=1 Tax=Pistacia atlantica TaxID=434234 RepID=A0ACC1AZ62_9ROSI|nr:hypothetical protein Patl1_25949 [Pistacia atlantica]